MESTAKPIGSVASRLAALLLCALSAPAWVVRAVLARRGSGRPLFDHAPRLWQVVRGELAFVGATEDDGLDSCAPGLVSPAALRRRMGIAHVERAAEDAHFLATAGASRRIGLLLRYAWASLLSSNRPSRAGTAAIFGVRLDALSMRAAVDAIVSACDAREQASMKVVAFVNPDCLNKAVKDRGYHHLLNESDLVLPDGVGLRIAAGLLQLPLDDNVNGTDLFPLLCEKAAATGKKLFLFGGRPGVALEAAERMRRACPGLEIVGCLDGYSHRRSTYAVIRAINRSGADIVLAGLGAPRQERWLHEHRRFLKAAVGIGVGGLFDYYSGRIARAPLWLREAGLEWAWRILQEPREKWRRYVVGNPLFLARVLRERRLRRRLADRGRAEQDLPSPAAWAARNADRATSVATTAPPARRRWRWALVVRSVAKRVLDVTVAAGAILALSPLLLVTAVLIRSESPGPVLYRQRRVGRRGRVFEMFKFRSMFPDADARLAELMARNESVDGVLFKMKKDPRITRVGRTIRRFSIDELPQLINVLRGDMSIVGPRPALPAEVANYTAADRKRLQTKPGLTCLWQIGGRSDLSFRQQVELDVAYLKKQNVITDLGIIARTVPAVINGKGAY